MANSLPPKSLTSDVESPTSTLHSRHCKICHHPDRHWIEQDFLNWRSPEEIRNRYGVGRSAIYRHADSAGLSAKRKRSFRRALESGIEHVGKAKMTASAVLKAMQTYARLNGDDRWTEPRKTITYHLHGAEALAFLESEMNHSPNHASIATARSRRD